MKDEKDVFKEEKFIDEKEEHEKLKKNKPGGRVVTYPIDFTIGSLNEQISKNNIVMDDDFQRRLVWNPTKSSKLIESLFMNVPIPVCYFAELDDGKYSVIDGKQRLGSIRKYFLNNLNLRRLECFSELNSTKYEELKPNQKRILESRTIRCIVILKESDPGIKYEIFERLNMNAIPLNKQELRNSIHRGKLNDLLKLLAKDKVFQKIRGVRDEDLRMNDQELILRFFAFYEKISSYQPPLADFLDSYLESGKNADEERIKKMQELFSDTIEKVNYVFDEKAFRKYDSDKKTWENRINRAIYDVIMFSFSNLSLDKIKEKKEKIINSFKKICGNEKFVNAITTWTKQTTAIEIRLNEWFDELSKIDLRLKKVKIG
ncbi:MAG: hypothetical protein CVU80_00455 [Elusimicrobia bacterium HGW-Elusimicrobia-4]|nr:MAG: hypothetical protein CVU80_00455 [Elusimicrobia bacterium HGW-Elusimicrobia-4]